MSNPMTRHRRPFLVVLLIVLFLGSALAGWVRLEQAIQEWAFLTQQVGAWQPLYLAAGGGLWGLAGLPAVWGLWEKSHWGKKAVWAAAAAYPAFYWIDRLFFARSPESRANWLFSAGATLVWLALVFWVLSRHSTLEYLRGNSIVNSNPQSDS